MHYRTKCPFHGGEHAFPTLSEKVAFAVEQRAACSEIAECKDKNIKELYVKSVDESGID